MDKNKMAVAESNERPTWGNPAEFVLTLLGYAVGLSNVLRFPYICMTNGGGAFLIPYFTCVVLCGIPLMFLEMVMGQYASTSCISCWDVYSPVCKGVGYGIALLSALCMLCYQTIYAWLIYYVYQSLTWNLPWTMCNKTWNTPACVTSFEQNSQLMPWTFNDSIIEDFSSDNSTSNNYTFDLSSVMPNGTEKRINAAEEFFHNKVLGISDGVEQLGGVQTHLLVCHVIGWLAIYICVIKGAKSVGKVVYVTATMPYVFIIIFLVRAALLPGSLEGVKYFITPNFHRLKEPQIWLQAFIQVFFSVGPGWGGIITMASYNKFHHRLHREAIAVPLISSLTSLLCGFLVFSVIGFMAKQTGRSIADAISSGPGLAFVVYPEAAAHFPGGPVWAVLFFVMLIMTGADSQFVVVETCISAVNDELKVERRKQFYVVTGTVLASCLVGVVFTTGAAMYIYQVIDWYIGVMAFLFVIVECVAMIWLYGHARLFDNIEAMIGKLRFKYAFVALWGVASPIVLMIAWSWSMAKMTAPTYGEYVYPYWIPYVGMLIPLFSALPIPIISVYRFMTVEGSSFRERLRITLFGGTNADDKHVDEVAEHLV